VICNDIKTDININFLSDISINILLVMGPRQFFFARVMLGQPFMVWVRKISPKNIKFFNFFPSGKKNPLWVGSKSTRVKGGSASCLLRFKSKLGSGRVGSWPISIFYPTQLTCNIPQLKFDSELPTYSYNLLK